MRVRDRIRISAVASVAVALAVLVVAALGLFRINRAMEQADVANEIVANALERSTLRNDYLRNVNERAAEQWFAKQSKNAGLLEAARGEFTAPEDLKTIAELIEDHQATGKIFSAIVQNRAARDSGAEAAGLSWELEDRLLSQMGIRVYKTVLNGRKLETRSAAALNNALRVGGFGVFGVLLVAVAAAVLNSWSLSRAITDRIRRLGEGAAAIGRGDLAHRIEMAGDDEFTELSATFNEMAERLRRTYGALAQEVEERRKAEAELQKAHDGLEEQVRVRTRELEEAQGVLQGLNETLEERVAQRTSELESANVLLRDSRLAALNMMEDAVAARRQAEDLAVELNAEQTKLADALDSLRRLHAEAGQRNVELEAANKDLESFIYSVSHDLRTPLRSMAWFSEYLLRDYGDGLDEKGRDMLLRIGRSSARMNAIIEDLLRLSRVSRQEVQLETVDLSVQAAAVIAELREAEPNRDVAVEIAAGVTARADPHLMRLALANLLGNAWKFTAKAAEPRIEFGAFARNGETVYLVRDNGIGFDPTFAGNIFLPFHRLHAEQTFEGTGIGLAIVERVIDRLSGRIWADGVPGEGATFSFTLGGQGEAA